MHLQKEKLWDYFILCARVILAWTFLRYGWSKLNDGQFGLTPEQMQTPVKDLGLFKLSWYLFEQQPFKAFIGISQLICALLLLYNRTLLLGALLSIPILLNILIINISYIQIEGFYWRLSYYLFLNFLILWHHRDKVNLAFKTIVGVSAKFNYPWWAYLALPLMAIGLELLGLLPRILTNLITNPTHTLEQLSKMPAALLELFKK